MTARSLTGPLLALALLALLASGCGEESSPDELPDGLARDDEAIALVEEVQRQVDAGDEDAGCKFLRDEPDGCTAWDVFSGRDPAGLVGGEVSYLWIDKHGQVGMVVTDDGARFSLRRAGESADGEWQITSAGYRPSERLADRVAEDAVAAATSFAKAQAAGDGSKACLVMSPVFIRTVEKESGASCEESFALLPEEQPRRVEPEVVRATVDGDTAEVGLRDEIGTLGTSLRQIEGRWLVDSAIGSSTG